MENLNGMYSFRGQRCCIFEFDNIDKAMKAMDFELIKSHGDTYVNEDGSIKHYLHTWDDGERSLVRCKKCGAYFIRQFSEFHAFNDSYYTDWFQVESPSVAEKLNEVYDGWKIEKEYTSPRISKTNGKYHWNKK